MYRAMPEARLAIARSYNGGRTWGAYQHYGSPNFRFFDHEQWPPEAVPRQPGTAAKDDKPEASASAIAGEAPDGDDAAASARHGDASSDSAGSSDVDAGAAQSNPPKSRT
jgi:hypothetical protein